MGNANISITKFQADLNGGDLLPNDIIEFAVTVTNLGAGGASNVTLTDPIPANTTYLAGTLNVSAGANTGPKTDGSGDDQAEFDGPNNRVVFRLGTGATAASGGTLATGETTTARFRVRVNTNAAVGSIIVNQATATFVNVSTGLGGGANGTVGPVPVVPEFSPLWLFGSGLVIVAWSLRRRRRS